MSERKCGGCTVCCEVIEIRSAGKPEMEWCSKCDVGTGCREYENRYQECRDFRCQWLMGYAGELDRPDLLGVMFDYYAIPGYSELGKIVVAYEFRMGAFESIKVKKRMQNILGNGLTLLEKYQNGRERLFVPNLLNVQRRKLQELIEKNRQVFIVDIRGH